MTDISSPYPIVPGQTLPQDGNPLLAILHELQNGNYEAIQRLIPHLASEDRFKNSLDTKVNRQARNLFADTCRHCEVKILATILDDRSASSFECASLCYALGRTLSLTAVPYLFYINDECDFHEVTDETITHLNHIAPTGVPYADDPDGEAFLNDHARRAAYIRKVDALDPSLYYYEGELINIPKLLSDLLARFKTEREGKKIYFNQNLFSNFSGIPCPIKSGTEVGVNLSALEDYVERVSDIPFVVGQKYFFGHLMG